MNSGGQVQITELHTEGLVIKLQCLVQRIGTDYDGERWQIFSNTLSRKENCISRRYNFDSDY